ncbi:hypothetical protein V494_03984 [Pseudogymnoascus sp. VKM F-4513 (FW-928)]|nr:hypothetical protein V494_03984 [Pseudogymnoascus sp. VKM F-4513 (FW-928)]
MPRFECNTEDKNASVIVSAQAMKFTVISFPDPASVSPDVDFNRDAVVTLPENLGTVGSLALDQNIIQTLSTNGNDGSGLAQGLLYVPDLAPTDPCFNMSKQVIPADAARRTDFPGENLGFIALAPWINSTCSLSFLNIASLVNLRAFIFYTNDNKPDLPPPISSAVWNMHDGGQWKSAHHFPVYAIPGSKGNELVDQLSRYSGNSSSVPFANQISNVEKVVPNSYIRVYTFIGQDGASGTLPGLWVFLLIAIASLGAALMLISFFMHFLQRRRRQNLRRRIISGETNLEVLGIKRLTVPMTTIQKMPVFIYMCEPTPAPPESGAKGAKNEEEQVYNIPVIDDPATGLRIQPQMYQPQSQPTCPICLDDYESLKSVVRELPCGHIFHPECIDHFLSKNSSLCPMCKMSALPIGFCPPVITNSMVRRERIRRLVRENAETEGAGDYRSRLRRWYNLRRIGDPHHISSVELQTRRNSTPPPIVTAPPLAHIPEGASRQAIVELRSQELMGNTSVSEEPTEERPRPKWRRAINKLFPTL